MSNQSPHQGHNQNHHHGAHDTGGSQHEPHHEIAPRPFSGEYWESRYQNQEMASSSVGDDANPYVVEVAQRLTPGTSIDVGCGTGAVVAWLARREWQALGVDISPSAIHSAQAAVLNTGASAARFEVADVTQWQDTASCSTSTYDLVTSTYAHPEGDPAVLWRRLVSLTKPGGTLVIVGHGAHDHHSAKHAEAPIDTSPETLRACIPTRGWSVVSAEIRHRGVTRPDGSTLQLEDVVLVAHREAIEPAA